MIQEDFEQHVVKLQNALLGFAKSLTHNEDEAKDLLWGVIRSGFLRVGENEAKSVCL